MLIPNRFSLRILFAFVSATAFVCVSVCTWLAYPERTAETIVAAIRSRDVSQLERLLGDGVLDDDLRRAVTRGRYSEHDVFLQSDDRTLAAMLKGRQSFLVSGYGGAHRFTVVRGAITELRYTFISGGIEYLR